MGGLTTNEKSITYRDMLPQTKTLFQGLRDSRVAELDNTASSFGNVLRVFAGKGAGIAYKLLDSLGLIGTSSNPNEE